MYLDKQLSLISKELRLV